MKLNELMPSVPRKARKRVGRGESSGLGKTSGKGSNGQKSRAGGGVKPYFEGGQMPIYRRVPKRGFSNALFKKEYAIIRLYIHTQIYTFGVPEKCGLWKIQNLKNCVAEIWKGEKPL